MPDPSKLPDITDDQGIRVVIVDVENQPHAVHLSSRSCLALGISHEVWDSQQMSKPLESFLDVNDLLIRPGVQFLRRPQLTDFVFQATGDPYWFVNDCGQVSRPEDSYLFIATESIRERFSLDAWWHHSPQWRNRSGERDGRLLRESLVRTVSSQEEFDLFLMRGIGREALAWGYLAVQSDLDIEMLPRLASRHVRLRAMRHLVGRKTLLRAIVVSLRLNVLNRKRPYFAARRTLGRLGLRIPLVRRFVQV